MKKGFTLVELVIVIVIVGILSIVAVPIYKGYVEKARMSEGKAFVSAIKTAQAVYYAEHGVYYTSTPWITYDNVLGIDARGNKYYKTFFTGNFVMYPGMWIAAVRGNANDDDDNIGLAWNADPSAPPMVVSGHRAPFFHYTVNGEQRFSNT